MKSRSFKEVVFLVLFLLILLTVNFVQAADGSGAATVSPGVVTAESVGNTLTLTYTAVEELFDGSIKFTFPSGWSPPQGVSGTVGYTTATTTGVTGSIENSLDTVTGWSDNSTFITLATDTNIKTEGSASLKNEVLVSLGRRQSYYNYAEPQDWSGYTTLAFWLYSTRLLSLGDLQLWISETGGVPDDATTVKYDIPNISANTWTYVTINLSSEVTSTRNAVLSYGLDIPLDVLSNYYLDNLILGPSSSSLSFDGQTATIQFSGLVNGGTVTLTYGDGGGSSGATAPAAVGTSTIAVEQRINTAGTLTQLNASPEVLVRAPAVTLSASASSVNVTEGGATDTYTVVLASPPSNNVTITINPDSQTTLSTSTLSFSVGDWSTPQEVVVTAVDDSSVEGAHTSTITHTASSTDSVYDGIPVSNVEAVIVDNDAAGISITESSGSTDVTEGGVVDTYTAVLTTLPTEDVILTVTDGEDTDVSPGSITFSALNWSTPQTFTVVAIDDEVVEGDHSEVLTHIVGSSDLDYNGLGVSSVIASITDNDLSAAITGNDSSSGGDNGGSSSGSAAGSPSSVSFLGWAFPYAQVELYEKDNYGGAPILRATTTARDGSFGFSLEGILQKVRTYMVSIYDDSGNKTPLLVYPVNTLSEPNAKREIITPPTLTLVRNRLTRGDFLKIEGKSLPGASVEIEIEDGVLQQTLGDNKGVFSVLISTARLPEGEHFVRARQTSPTSSHTSSFSIAKSFSLSNKRVSSADLNGDDVTDIRDWSIFLSRWGAQEIHTKALDLNLDGRVNISDFAVFLKEFRFGR